MTAQARAASGELGKLRRRAARLGEESGEAREAEMRERARGGSLWREGATGRSRCGGLGQRGAWASVGEMELARCDFWGKCGESVEEVEGLRLLSVWMRARKREVVKTAASWAVWRHGVVGLGMAGDWG